MVGGLFAYLRAKQQNAEALGGAIAGYAGAKLPDIIDPPTHPGHRSIAHGVIPTTAAGVAYAKELPKLQERLRTKVSEQTSPTEKFLLQVGAGAVAGLPAGYTSHLVLDASTPAGLPLLM